MFISLINSPATECITISEESVICITDESDLVSTNEVYRVVSEDGVSDGNVSADGVFCIVSADRVFGSVVMEGGDRVMSEDGVFGGVV